MIRWKFRLHAALPPHPQSGGHRGRRRRVRAGVQRPDRRDRRRQVHPRRGGRAPPRRPGVGRPGPDRRDAGDHRSDLRGPTPGGPRELVVRREITSQGRSRSFINGALATAGALRDLSQRLVELHGQHEHQALLDPSTHLPLLDAYAGLERLRGTRRRRRGRRARTCASSSTGRGWTRARRAARLDLIAFQLGEIEKAAPKAGRGRGARGDAAGARQRRAGAAAVRGELRGALRQRRGRARPGSAASGSGSASWRRSIRSSRRYVDARDGIKSQLEDLAFFLRGYADGVDASPERLQQVEDRLALARAAEAQVRTDACRTSSTAASRSRRERELLTGAAEAAEDLRAATRRRRPTRSSTRRASSRARGARRRCRSRASSRRCSPSWRWRARASRCASTTTELAAGGVGRARHRRGRVLRLAEPRRGCAAARADRLGRRAVARHAGAEDDGARGRTRGGRQDAHLRRGRRRHRRPRRGRRRRAAARARRALSGALHHAPAADCRARRRRSSASRSACAATGRHHAWSGSTTAGASTRSRA